MSVVHRSLVVWTVLATFCGLVALKLEGRFEASWFAVFASMWLLDLMLLFLLFLQISASARYDTSPALVPGTGARASLLVRAVRNPFVAHTIARWQHIVVLALKILCQVLLCMRLDSPKTGPPLIFIFLPLWLILISILVSLTRSLVKSARSN